MAKHIVLLFAAFLLLTGQDFSDEDRTIIEEGVAIKIEEFVIKNKQACRDKALRAALVHVDSMIRVGALVPKVDPVQKPERPIKPGQPAMRTLPDSINHSLLRRDSVR